MDSKDGKHRAVFFESLSNGWVRCQLCPRGCKLNLNQVGFCGVRQNIGGALFTLIYGQTEQVAQEYLETEGIFHFAPGAPVLSLSSPGCNLQCKFCQNCQTSPQNERQPRPESAFTPAQIVQLARRKNIKILAWTGKEPAVWHEFVMDTARLARQHGLLNLYKSALYLTREVVQELCQVMDIFSVSLQSVREDYYRAYTSGTLAPILENIRLVQQQGLHLEISNLMITDLNDTPADARALAQWHLEHTSADIPLHLVRFLPARPDEKALCTPIERLEAARKIAQELGVKYCYVRNVFGAASGNTFCPQCRHLLIERYDCNVHVRGLDAAGRCTQCNYQTNIRLRQFPPVLQPAQSHSFQHLSREVYRWSEAINRLHVEVTNPDAVETEVHLHRLGASGSSASTASNATTVSQSTKILPTETYRFLVARAQAEETGVVISYPPTLKIRILELVDRTYSPPTWRATKKENLQTDRTWREKMGVFFFWERGLNSKVARYLTYPAYLKIKGLPLLGYLKALEQTQYYSAVDLQQVQFQRLQRLLQHCEKYVPYYQRLFVAHDFRVQDLRTPDDLAALPLLEKSTIFKNREALLTQGLSLPYFKARTTGSTGRPLEFFNDYDSVSASIAARWRAERWWGLDFGLREAHFWGRGFNQAGLALRLGDYLIRNKIILSAFYLSEEKMFSYYQRLLKFRPQLIYGNPSAIYIFTRFTLEHNLDLSKIRPQAVISTTEILHDFQKDLIQKVFGCPTINEYGGSEVGIIAYECPQHRMHISAENIILEIQKDGRPCEPGEFGEIIITNLNNRIMPFIRYRLGDVGAFQAGACSCGCKLPLLDLAIGRDCDTIILEDRELPGAILFSRLGKELNTFVNGQLETYKIYQQDFHHFLFQAVLPEVALRPQFEARALQVLRELLGEKITMAFEYVDAIPRESTGKLRYFVSQVLRRQG
ncbi:AmmeMemoRadiSam system radical SAM enzyme [candidate division KSB1 bacterium]|nr:AmmeMemoRadiSam system radical SAM enzyme [candidate division KSB1 bacterium]